MFGRPAGVRLLPVFGAVVSAAVVVAAGLIAMPPSARSESMHTSTTSAQLRQDLAAYRTYVAVRHLDYSGYHHWPSAWSPKQ